MKYVRTFLFVFLIIFSSASNLKADSIINTPEIIVKANQLYKEAKFSEAIKLYQQVEESGISNGDLFYNIGNAYAKNNNTGMAIAYYLKAQKYIPADTDLKANLALISSKVVDKTEPTLKDKIFEKAFFWNNLFNIEEITIIFLILWSLFWMLFIFIKRAGAKSPAIFKTGLNLVALISFVIALSWLFKISNAFEKNAIVIVQEADIKTGIDSNSITLFKLHEGSKIKLLQRSESWSKIEYSQDKRGWIQNASIYDI